MPSYVGLYYPFIHFRGGDDWLKLSALYWDEMHRIVPIEDQPPPSPVECVLSKRGGITRDGREQGFIHDHDPSSEAKRVGEIFADFVDDNKERLRGSYGVTHQGRWRMGQPGWIDPRDNAQASPKFARVYYGKISERLREKLLSSDLAEDRPWACELRMHPRLAAVWMTLLAEEIARSRGLSPVTDDVFYHIAVNGCTPEQLGAVLLGTDSNPNRRSDGDVESRLVTIAMKAYAPKALAQMDADDVLRFREENRTLLLAYRKWMGGFIKDWSWLEGVSDWAEVEQRLQQLYETDLKPALDGAEKQGRPHWAITTGAALSMIVAVPPAMTHLFGVPVDPGLISGAIMALGVLRVSSDQQRGADDRAKQNGAYMLRLRRWRKPSGMVAAVRNWAAKLTG